MPDIWLKEGFGAEGSEQLLLSSKAGLFIRLNPEVRGVSGLKDKI